MAKLYLGDTEIAPIVEVPTPETVGGMTISDLYELDSTGTLSKASGSLTLKGVVTLGNRAGTNLLMKITSFSAPDLVTIDGYGLSQTGALVLTSFDVPELTTIEAYGMQYAFENLKTLTSLEFPKLTTIGIYGLAGAFANTNINSISFPKLVEIQENGLDGAWRLSNVVFTTPIVFPSLTTLGRYALIGAFQSTTIEKISFPALTTVESNSFGTSTLATSRYAFYSATVQEIHFPAAMEETISSMTGFSAKWGASSATIYFDL